VWWCRVDMFNVDESDWIKCVTVMEMEGVRQRDS